MKTNKLIYQSLCLLSITIFSSCSAIYYVPNTQDLPLFTEKNVGRADIAIGTTDYTNILKVSGAYAFADHFGVTANAFFVGDQGNGIFPDRTKERGGSAGIGVVHFLPFGKHGVFETTLGYAGGEVHNNPINDKRNDITFSSIYVQPSLGYAGKHFEIALSIKYNVQNYADLNHALVQMNKTDQIGYPEQKGYHFLEPAATIRFGWPAVKIQFQLVQSILLGNSSLNRDVVNFNFGLHFKIKEIK